MIKEKTIGNSMENDSMNPAQRKHERWIWTDLIGFDNRQADLGVGEYLDGAGFVPEAICLLMTSPDFVLSHAGIEEQQTLPPDFCSRNGHDFNRLRKRQAWTNHQVRDLIRRLHDRGSCVYLTVFTGFCENKFHHEWLSDHPDVFGMAKSTGVYLAFDPLARLKDGCYVEDYFVAQLVKVLCDYGFDGWHGADGWGPSSGAIYEMSFSDDLVGQFAEKVGGKLPAVVTDPCGNNLDKLKTRFEWLWRNRRREWIDFYANRWARFWQKVVDALHGADKKAVINSAWGRAPFEALYRYGIDYRKIVNTGVDGIVVETVAAGLHMDPSVSNATIHYDFLAMLMLIKVYVPDAKLIFLHNVHDVVEEWDVLRHAPAVLEKEIYCLANVFHVDSSGQLRPCADGFLVCLGDGISRTEWNWLRAKWALAFAEIPVRTIGATLVWSDAAFHRQLDDFIQSRAWFTHRLLYCLMARGAPIQSTVRVNDLHQVRGPILALNPHLFSDEERVRLFNYRNGPVILIGRRLDGQNRPAAEFDDVYQPQPLWCGVYNTGMDFRKTIVPDGEEHLPPDVMNVTEPNWYWDHLPCRRVSQSFLDACAQVLLHSAAGIRILSEENAITFMIAEQGNRRLRVAIKSKVPVYVRPLVDMGRPIRKIEVLTEFPSVVIRPEGARFRVRVPGHGIVVVEVELDNA